MCMCVYLCVSVCVCVCVLGTLGRNSHKAHPLLGLALELVWSDETTALYGLRFVSQLLLSPLGRVSVLIIFFSFLSFVLIIFFKK